MRRINVDDKDLVIIVKGSKVYVFQNGKQEQGITRVEFTAALEELPQLKIEKYVYERRGKFENIE